MDKSQIEHAVRESRSFRQAAKLLGTNHAAVKRQAIALGIDTAHFDFGRRSFSYVGRTFNKLTIREVFQRKGRWFCRCDCACGTTGVEKRLDGVIDGHVPSCGCAYRNRPMMVGSQNPAFAGCGEILGSRIYWIKRGAARRGIPFDISKEYLWTLFETQEKRCALSGVDLVFGRMYHSHETTASLDRIDSSKGYIEGNVQWVHKDVNKIKRDLNQEYFLAWCHRISAHSRTQTPAHGDAAE